MSISLNTLSLSSVVDRCTTAVCLNGGTCRNYPGSNSYHCECPGQTSGLYCEVVGKYLLTYCTFEFNKRT